MFLDHFPHSTFNTQLISYLEGKIEHIGDKYVILSTGGVGYRVIVVPKLLNIVSKINQEVNPIRSSLAEVPKGTRAVGASETSYGTSPENTNIPLLKLFIHSQLNMREGSFDMYGFDKKDDLELFHLLTSVSGIGPKGAMNILSVVEPKHLKAAVVNEDSAYLKKVSGLGPKTASRLVLELKNKVDHIDMGDMTGIDLGQDGQAVEALASLGYSIGQAKDALKEVKGKTLQEKVTLALKLLGKK